MTSRGQRQSSRILGSAILVGGITVALAAAAAAPARAGAGRAGTARSGAGRSGTARALAAGGPSGSLGYATIEGFWIDAGGPPSVARIAAAITGAESSFLPGNIQPGVDYCGARSDKAGWGLWQITCGNSVPQFGSDFQVLDPWNNAEAAVAKYYADERAGLNGFDPWATYTSGAYESFLQSAAPSYPPGDPGQYVQVHSTPPGTPASPAPDPGSTDGPPFPAPNPPARPAVTLPGAVVRGTIRLTAADSDSSVTSVTFYVDGKRAGTGARSGTTWSLTWNSASVLDGVHSVYAVAANAAGTTTSRAVSFTVLNVLRGSAAIWDPDSGAFELYATSRTGTLAEDAWNGSWRGWKSVGGSITGTPSAIYDPLTGNLEVYATGKNGALEEDAWNKAHGWHGWRDLGGDLTGSPAAVYDTADGNLDVYATGAGQAIEEITYRKGQGWTAWRSLGGDVSRSASPSVIDDPASGNIEVYTVTAGGPLEEDAWNAAHGWHGWRSLGGAHITGSPSAAFDPLTGNLDVYVIADRSLFQATWSKAHGWSTLKDLGGSISGNPAALYDVASGNMEVYATAAASKHLVEDAFRVNPVTGGGSWTGFRDLAGTVTGSPVAVSDPLTGRLEVYVNSGGPVFQRAWSPTRSWSAWLDLGGQVSSP